ncbi:MAG: flavin reductase family protein [Thermoanaerobacteraceae bacterium]|nr:flavin reductase family protein [Thermoanaerobacteraceae bacterium]
MREARVEEALGLLVCPCAVIGAKKGEVHDLTTVAWVTQESMDPPQITVALHPQRYVLELIRQAGEFVLSLLAHDQEKIASFCGSRSGRDTDKIKALGLELEPSREVHTPRLKRALANLECKVAGEYTSGDHVIVVGRVVAADMDPDQKPLLFYRQQITPWR